MPMNLAGSAFPNARTGPEPLPVLDIRGPHPLCAPKNKARRRPVPGPPAVRCQAAWAPLLLRPSSRVPAEGGISARPPRGGPRSGLVGLSRGWGSSWSSRGPLHGEGQTQRCRRGLPAPLPQPPQQWRAGLQRPGRPPPGREQVREGVAAGSRRRRVLPNPRPAGGPRPARAPGPPGARAHLVLGRRRVSPLLSKTCPEKPPEPRRLHGKLHFGGSRAGQGLPRPRAGGGGRGAPAPARTRGRRLPPARLSVSVTCPRSPPPPPPPPSLLPAPCRAVGPAAALCAPRPPARLRGTKAGMPIGLQDAAPGPPHRGHGDTGARAGARWNPDARRPQRRTGSTRAQRHANHKHREGCAGVFQTQTQGRE